MDRDPKSNIQYSIEKKELKICYPCYKNNNCVEQRPQCLAILDKVTKSATKYIALKAL